MTRINLLLEMAETSTTRWRDYLFKSQLVERSLRTPEVRGSNPVIGKILFIINGIEKTKEKKKEVDNGPFKNPNVVI